FLLLPAEDPGGLEEQLPAAGRGRLPPLFERALRRVDRVAELLLRREGEGREDLTGGRVPSFEPLALGFLPLAADEETVVLDHGFTRLGARPDRAKTLFHRDRDGRLGASLRDYGRSISQVVCDDLGRPAANLFREALPPGGWPDPSGPTT